jgi:hypothetical protein
MHSCYSYDSGLVKLHVGSIALMPSEIVLDVQMIVHVIELKYTYQRLCQGPPLPSNKSFNLILPSPVCCEQHNRCGSGSSSSSSNSIETSRQR